MRRVHLLSLLVIATLGCGGASPRSAANGPSGDGPYEIHLVRRLAVGASWVEVSSSTSSSTTRTRMSGGQWEAETEATGTTLEARHTVLAVDAEGRASRTRIEIRRLTVVDATGASASPAVPGVVIVETGETGSVVGETGEVVSDEAAQALRTVVAFGGPDGTPDDDSVFGTSAPQAIGASWPVDAAAMAATLSGAQMSVAAPDVSGQTTLVGRVSAGGRDCLDVSTSTQIHNVGIGGMPDGAEVRSATVVMTGTGTLPMDISLPAASETTRTEVVIDVVAPSEMGPIEMNIASVDEERHQRTFD